MGINVIFNKTEYDLSNRKLELLDKYNRVIQWGRQHPVRFMEHFFKLEFTDHQKYVLLSSWTPQIIVWLMSRNSGKALDLKTKVYKSDSECTVGDLKVGDEIYGSDGNLTKVIHLNPVLINEDTYEIEFEDGEKIQCNKEHIWCVYDRNKRECTDRNNFVLCTIEDIIGHEKTYKKNSKYFEYRFHIPLNKPINYTQKEFLIHPYLLGAWLGDGYKHAPKIASSTNDVAEMTEILTPYVNNISYEKEKLKENGYVIKIDVKSQVKDTLLKNLRELNIYKNKHIPEEYFYGSIEQRVELLQGLMDTDGAVCKSGYCEFTQSNYNLIHQVSRLLNTLGIKNNVKHKITNYIKKDGTLAETYRIQFRTDKELPCFKLTRKLNRLPDKLIKCTTKKAIISIKKVTSKPMRCITIENPDGLFLCGEKCTVTHNSYLSAPFIMAKSILIPNFHAYIMSVTGGQSQETFGKMEDLALGQIASVTGTTQVFLNEILKKDAGQSGFVHDKNSHYCTLYNGSSINTLNSKAENIVGIRSNLNFYDEAGKIDRNFYDLTKPFATQNTDFITGSGVNANCYPRQMPNQIIYASSAEDIFTELWDAYKIGAMEMIMGNDKYFVCDIDCRFSLSPTMNGKPFQALISKDKVDDAIEKNEFKANREYFNKFDTSGGQDALVNHSTLILNSQGYEPIFENPNGETKFLIIYDPSSKLDNSVILVAIFFKDPQKGHMLKIVNCKNLIEKKKNGEKKILQKPEQIKLIKQIILDYNGSALDYKNIERVIIDGGSGGGGSDISQFLMPNWRGEDGTEHLGLIDKEDSYSKEFIDRFPAAKDILTLANFTRDKVKMYEDTQDAIYQGLVIFPKDLNPKNEMEFERINEQGTTEYYWEKLDSKGVSAITEIEMMKYELMGIQKNKNTSTNKISFDTVHSKKLEGLKDDRADCMAMACHYLMKLRAKDKLDNYKPEGNDFTKLFKEKVMQKDNNPFSGGANPFINNGGNPFLN